MPSEKILIFVLWTISTVTLLGCQPPNRPALFVRNLSDSTLMVRQCKLGTKMTNARGCEPRQLCRINVVFRYPFEFAYIRQGSRGCFVPLKESLREGDRVVVTWRGFDSDGFVNEKQGSEDIVWSSDLAASLISAYLSSEFKEGQFDHGDALFVRKEAADWVVSSDREIRRKPHFVVRLRASDGTIVSTMVSSARK